MSYKRYPYDIIKAKSIRGTEAEKIAFVVDIRQMM